ncbi:ABC transporter substrate-binding protein [Microlunatus kandeliicorticis]|nr:ABC transporter substrate-binding protein [Microlunatus kandeliicorticis]
MRLTAGLGAAVMVAATALSGCGSNSLSGQPAGQPSTETSTKAQTVDQALAAKLPASIKSAGVIKIGTDPTYAPNEFLDSDGKTVIGADVDLFDAVAAKLGVKAEFVPSSFDTIIVGVQSGKYDMGISSFTINAEREKQVTMVSYYSAGTQWATQAGNPKGVQPDNACGKTVAVQKATVQDTDDLPARQKKCGSNPIKVLRFTGQDQATAAVVGGRADAMLADSPVTAYAVKQSQGKLATVGDVYDAAPYGYVVKKDQTDFADALAGALKEIEADGSYKAALEKWGIQSGAVTSFEVNPSS